MHGAGRRIDLDIIFRNLIDNAVKYAGPATAGRGHVCGRSRTARSWSRIADNGRGIPHKLRRKIFGRFVRLGQELEREKPGTGLGLYIVRTLVRRLRGRIRVRDRRRRAPGSGVRSANCPTSPARKGRRQCNRCHNEHILVVEDEEHLATGIKYNLVAEGYRVTTVGDGPSALQIHRRAPRRASTW